MRTYWFSDVAREHLRGADGGWVKLPIGDEELLAIRGYGAARIIQVMLRQVGVNTVLYRAPDGTPQTGDDSTDGLYRCKKCGLLLRLGIDEALAEITSAGDRICSPCATRGRELEK